MTLDRIRRCASILQRIADMMHEAALEGPDITLVEEKIRIAWCGEIDPGSPVEKATIPGGQVENVALGLPALPGETYKDGATVFNALDGKRYRCANEGKVWIPVLPRFDRNADSIPVHLL